MNFQDLQFNRFGYKSNQTSGTADASQLSANNRGTVPLPADNIKEANDNSKNARNVITGTVITSCFFQTSALPNRVEISGNDARFYDDSTGGTGSINGDTSTIQFIRSDKNPGNFIIQKRHGANNNLENVFEMFYSEVAAGGQNNYVFIGRSGVATDQKTFTDFIILHGKNSVRTEITRIYEYDSRPTFLSSDYSKIDPTKQGVVTYIAGEGKDGFSALGKLGEQLNFASSTSFAVGDTITGNVTGATALLIQKVSSSVFYADHTNNISFNPAVDNACTTNGAGGGSGTGDLSATTFELFNLVTITPDLNVLIGGNILPDTPGVYNIGSPSAKFGNFYGAVVACPLPTVTKALDVIRKIPEPTYVGDRGHFGDGLYFDDRTFPEEVMHHTDEGLEIEHTRMIGLLMQAMRELTVEVDLLKKKLAENGIY